MWQPMKNDEESLRTSWTAVARLKNTDDQEVWNRFYDRYRPLIFGVAVKAGLQQEEAQEVVQETMLSVSRHIQEFVAEPARGSFRAWLLNMARWRIQDQLRKRLPVVASGGPPSDGTATTGTVERVPDGREVDLEGLCDAEWKDWLMEQALGELPLEVKAEHYQIFHLLAIEQKSIAEVAKIVGRNRAQIYLIKHRVANALKKIIRRLEKELG
jgi:RNA polymerase sigma-70 factor (ECF subfamily)